MNPARRILAACLAAALALPLPPALAAKGDDADNRVSLNFVNADIGAVIQAVSKISGRNFVVDPRVKGTLNIVTARPVERRNTYPILLSALRLQGYAAIEGDGVTKIVPEADAKLHAVPVGKGQGSGGGDRLTTQVFTLKHESAAQIVPVLRPLISPNNTVTAYPGNNTLVVTDYAENLGRIAQIIESIDVPQGDMRMLPLKHASALDLAATINRLLGDGSAAGAAGQTGDTSQRVTVIGDARTNSLLIRSDNPSKIQAVRQLVGNLDQPGAAGNIHVVYLKNADATKVAQTLRAVLSGESGTTGTSGSTATSSSFAPTGAGTFNSGTTTGSTFGQNTATTTGGGNFSGSSGTSTGVPNATGGGVVQADPMNNALIITAPDTIYTNLRQVVDQLDRRRAQVYVEALITEVSTDKAAEIGIQWQAGKVGTTSAYGGTAFTSSSSGSNLLTLATALGSGTVTSPGNGLNLVLGSGSVTVGGKTIANLNMLARFLESDSRANILSTPNLVTLDNEEAKIVVGRNLPFVTGSYATTGGTTTTNPFTTIERKDVGLTLKVKPQITEGGLVRMQIYQEASSVIDTTTANTYGPTTNKRSIESTVLVDDGATIALGGLVEDSFSGTIEKVPVLGDIPYLGAFFRYDTRKRTKTNLIVFLRPVILRDAAAIRGISSDRYDYIIGQQRRMDGEEERFKFDRGLPSLPPAGSPPPATPTTVPQPSDRPAPQ